MNQIMTHLRKITCIGFTPIIVLLLASCATHIDLHQAARDGDTAAIQLYIADRGQIDVRKKKGGHTPLITASTVGQKEVVQLLIDSGADVNAKSTTGFTALYAASRKGHKDIVDLLIRHGAEVNQMSKNGSTALSGASIGGHDSIVHELIRHGAEVNVSTRNGNTPLYFAATNGHREVVKQLLDAGANVNARTKSGRIPLHGAAWKGHVDIITQLIDAGTPLDVVTEKSKLTPLHVALMGKINVSAYKKYRKQLSEMGIKLPSEKEMLADPKRATAVMSKQLKAAVKKRAGGDARRAIRLIMQMTIDMSTPNSEEAALRLISAGADVNLLDALGYTPLHWAASSGAYDAAVMLIDHNANLDVKSSVCLTPLHESLGKGKTRIANLLIARGANTEIRCSAVTPLKLSFFYIFQLGDDADRSTFTKLLAMSTYPADIQEIKQQATELGMTDIVNLIDRTLADKDSILIN